MDYTALPYCGAGPTPSEFWGRWNVDVIVIAGLLAAFVAALTIRVRIAPMTAGLALLALLFLSPLCALSSSLFAMRVTHHLVLTSLAAPLFAMALARGGGSVPVWAAIHALVFWAWHAPLFYAYALASDAAYWLMQASLMGSAVMIWRAIRAATAPLAIAGLLATMVQMGLLGALLTFTKTPLYAWHAATTQAWGLTPLADQQLAGLIMWVVGGALYLLAALRLAASLLGRGQRMAPA